jgi:DNA-directed RNA polymerase subunit H (RpoH/RPB5)
MIADRGYELKRTLLYRNGNSMLVCEKSDGKSFYLFDFNVGQFNIDQFERFHNVIKKFKTQHAMILHWKKVTTKTAQMVRLMRATPIPKSDGERRKIELFRYQDLKYNIVRHYLQPVFRLLRDPDETLRTWPKFGSMRTLDPVARYYDYEKGDVVLVTRRCGMTYIRIVVEEEG